MWICLNFWLNISVDSIENSEQNEEMYSRERDSSVAMWLLQILVNPQQPSTRIPSWRLKNVSLRQYDACVRFCVSVCICQPICIWCSAVGDRFVDQKRCWVWNLVCEGGITGLEPSTGITIMAIKYETVEPKWLAIGMRFGAKLSIWLIRLWRKIEKRVRPMVYGPVA